jgi:hypothetical protein
MVMHACYLSTEEAETGKSQVQGQPGYTARLFQNKNNAGCRWLMPIILATQEAEIRRIVV